MDVYIFFECPNTQTNSQTHSHTRTHTAMPHHFVSLFFTFFSTMHGVACSSLLDESSFKVRLKFLNNGLLFRLLVEKLHSMWIQHLCMFLNTHIFLQYSKSAAPLRRCVWAGLEYTISHYHGITLCAHDVWIYKIRNSSRWHCLRFLIVDTTSSVCLRLRQTHTICIRENISNWCRRQPNK